MTALLVEQSRHFTSCCRIENARLKSHASGIQLKPVQKNKTWAHGSMERQPTSLRSKREDLQVPALLNP